MNGAAVPHDITVSGYELLERCIDVVEIDVSDETIDAGIDAGGFLAMQITPRGDETGKRP
jgi:predicted rRNA methylase YqxC with S4 and FtsJ domains